MYDEGLEGSVGRVFYDAVNGETLPSEEVRKARKAKMEYVRRMAVYILIRSREGNGHAYGIVSAQASGRKVLGSALSM